MADLALMKGKYMPLSETNIGPVMLSSFDGQNLCVGDGPHRSVRYSLDNYLGGGLAGVVYEAADASGQPVAVKILNPVGYKLTPVAALRRAEIIKSGSPIMGPNLRALTLDNVYWVRLPNRRDLVACYVDGRGQKTAQQKTALRELTLEMCVALWPMESAEADASLSGRQQSEGENPDSDLEEEDSDEDISDDHSDDGDDMEKSHSGHESRSGSNTIPNTRRWDDPLISGGREETKRDDDAQDTSNAAGDGTSRRRRRRRRGEAEYIRVGDTLYKIPRLPAKYLSFLQSRRTIYREIAHMHKLTGNSVSGQFAGGGHENVLKLYDVMELVQGSKSTIFLVLELAGGGELFDRIRGDAGVEEDVARGYFRQLLSGVLYCHHLGIVHRDLKPENLLLSDLDVLKIADFGLSAHFIAAVSTGSTQEELVENRQRLYAGDDNQTPSGSPQEMTSLMMPAQFRRLNSIVGSPHYVAPEVLQNARYGYDGRKSDMWSIGVILYGLLVGSLPFGKELTTCPRYLKFCEWIRSLPTDAYSGKLVYVKELYEPGPFRVLSPSTSVSSSSLATTTTSVSTVKELDKPGSHSMRDEDAGSEDEEPTSDRPFQPSALSGYYPSPGSSGVLGAIRVGNSSNASSSGRHAPSRGSAKGTVVTPKPLSPLNGYSSSRTSDRQQLHAGLGLSSDGDASNGKGRARSTRSVSFPGWFFPSKLSPHAIFLLSSLLHPDPAKRSSCEDACKSPWMTE